MSTLQPKLFTTFTASMSWQKLAFTSLCAFSFSSVTMAPAFSITTLSKEQNPPLINKSQLISQAKSKVEISLVSFAVTKGAYDNIIPLFQAKWKQEQNQEVIFRQSYAGSGIQTRAIIKGLPADVVHLAVETDVNKIEREGLIRSGWQKRVPNNGIVARTVGAIVTRPGNPKGIVSWVSLTKPGVKVVTADPKTSGIGIWNFLTFWGSISQYGGNDTKARAFVNNVYRNVPILARDARDLTDIFLRRNIGDAIVNYENELLSAESRDLPFIVPQINISIDTPVAVVDKYVDRRGTRKVSEAFVKFLYSTEAQREFAKAGFRPFNPAIAQEFGNKYPPVTKLFTVADLGGWDNIDNKFFKEGAIFEQLRVAIYKSNK